MKLTKKNLLLTIIAAVCFFVVVVVVNRFNNLVSVTKTSTQEYVSVEQGEKGILVSDSISNQAYSTTTDGIYRNNEYGFSITYPLTSEKHCKEELWGYSEMGSKDYFEVSFGPPCSKAGGYIFGIYICKNCSIEELIKQIGVQFSDRKEERQMIDIDGVSALLVTVTTKQIKDWGVKKVFIIKENTVIAIGGEPYDSEFDSFYKSLAFIK